MDDATRMYFLLACGANANVLCLADLVVKKVSKPFEGVKDCVKQDTSYTIRTESDYLLPLTMGFTFQNQT